MDIINLQEKTRAQKGRIELFWFENKSIDLPKTLFHKIIIPLESFNTKLGYGANPLETEIVIDWLNLKLEDPKKLDNLELKTILNEEIEVSIYVGNAHNSCDIIAMTLKKIKDNLFKMKGELFIEFEHEGVAKNESFSFITELELNPFANTCQ